MHLNLKHTSLILVFLFSSGYQIQAQEEVTYWPEITNTTKPWTRWWWMGNAIDQENIKRSLIEFDKAGLGGVEITPIYGVKGEEANYIDYLSPKWMKMLNYTIKTADSLGMQVDMTLGTGWPYGGPHVTQEYAATKLIIDQQKVAKGSRIKQHILVNEEKDQNSAQLKHVLAFGEDGTNYDLTNKLDGDFLKWKAKKTNYMMYSVFTGKTRQQVKRAAPGGKGFTLDHYSNEAVNTYLEPFQEAFKSIDHKPRSVFNDSYEVYGTDFTPLFFEEFETLRGYDVKKYIPELLGKEDDEIGNRIKSDYRETLSDLLLNNFEIPWSNWAHSESLKTKLQAHGSPGNLIDIYASADIPECETFGSMPYDIPGFRREKEDIREGDADAVMLKFSSSAAHISGKPLTSSETFTWLRDHFKTALSQAKPEVEDLLLNGINHVFLHGSTYSPERAVWPGWKFYASVNFNSTNTIWEDAPSLFSYISNCQSMLQSGKPDNEVLVYWPIYDTWGSNLNGTLFFEFKIHSLKEWLHGTPFYNTTRMLIDKGYSVDFISDTFISQAKVIDGQLVLPGGAYKTMVIPDTNKMPLATLQKLIELKKQGAPIIFQGVPESVPGFHQYEAQNKELNTLIQSNKDIIQPTTKLITSLLDIQLFPESLVDTGLKFIRRDIDGDKIYYVVNHTAKTVAEYIPLSVEASEVVIYDPLTKQYGKAAIENDGNSTLVKVNIPSGKSLFLKTGKPSNIPYWNYYETAGHPLAITGDWKLKFLKGGPKLPESTTIASLKSWTVLNQDAENFSGTAAYEITFDKPKIDADNWQLNLGDVRESAKVWLNDVYIGDAWSVPFMLNTGVLKEKNNLTIQVTNLAANRIRAKEIRGEEWKIFHEINMVDKNYKKFDATLWEPMPSGLLGEVTLTPLKLSINN
tara:strand:+ start:44326 stop:47064 length:2739 start_codon:yes stop_codon:yes gene_type:complete